MEITAPLDASEGFLLSYASSVVDRKKRNRAVPETDSYLKSLLWRPRRTPTNFSLGLSS